MYNYVSVYSKDIATVFNNKKLRNDSIYRLRKKFKISQSLHVHNG